MTETIFHALSAVEKNHETAALCTVIKSAGSTPRHVGSKLLVYPGGNLIGTVGGGELENRVIQAALLAIENQESKILKYNMADPSRGDPGVCGGQVEVFVEPILPAPLVVIIGAGHVGKAVVHLAKWLGYRVAVNDDREDFCTSKTVPGADDYYPVPMDQLPDHLHIDNRTFLILTTRGSSVDSEGMAPLLASKAGYIGVIGSKRRWATTAKALLEKGVSQEALARVHSPIGLELQAETPEEIAVSIMAEVMMVQARATSLPMKKNPLSD